MARTSPDDLQRLVQSLVETFDAHLDVVRRDMAAQQEAMVHEVRSLHEATIRAMAELRAAVHRVELALHDQFAALEPTPAAGIARPHIGTSPTHPAPPVAPPARAVAEVPTVAAPPVARPTATGARATTASTAAAEHATAPEVATPSAAPAPTEPVQVATPVEEAAPVTAPAAADTPVIPTLAERPVAMVPPEPEPAPSPSAGLDVDRLVAMLESRLGEIDMTSGTPPATPTA